jgi:hypothetical protein
VWCSLFFENLGFFPRRFSKPLQQAASASRFSPRIARWCKQQQQPTIT